MKKQNQILRKQLDNEITFIKSFHKLVPIKLKSLDTINVGNDKMQIVLIWFSNYVNPLDKPGCQIIFFLSSADELNQIFYLPCTRYWTE